MTQVIYNRTYNHNLNDYEHMYRLEIYGNLFGDNWGCSICRPFATMLRDIPQVKSVVYYSPYVNQTDVKVNNRTITVPIVYMSKPGIEFFTGKLISGSSKSWGTELLPSLTAAMPRRCSVRRMLWARRSKL